MRLVSLENLTPGLPLAKCVYDSFGRILLVQGTPLTAKYIQRLKDLEYKSVYVDNGNAEFVEVDEAVSEETRMRVFQATRKALLNVSAGNSIHEKRVKEVVSDVIDEIVSNRDTIIHLTDIRSMQDHTFGHSVNVCILSVLTGMSLGFNQLKLMDLGTGALLHDIGKAKLLDEVNSEQKLTEAGFQLIQKHCDYGFQVLKNTDNISILSAHVAWQHHERYDGSGYPRKLSGKAILEFARIVSIADVYDALVTDRPYRGRMLPHQVIEYLEQRQGLDFDPDIVPEFIRNIAPYPIGSLVTLNSGEKGIVTVVKRQNPTRPKVKLLSDSQGYPIEETCFRDLMVEPSVFITDVLKE